MGFGAVFWGEGSVRVIPLREALAKLFPEQRELILRSQGRVRYIRAGRPIQIAAVTLTAGVLILSAYSTTRFMSHEAIVSDRNEVIADLRDRNEILSTDLQGLRELSVIQRLSLTAMQQNTVDLASRNLRLKSEVKSLEDHLGQERARAASLALSYQAEVESKAHLNIAMQQLESSRADMRRQIESRDFQLAMMQADRETLSSEVDGFHSQVARLKAEAESIDVARARLQDRLTDTTRQLESAVEEKLAVDRQRESLGTQVAELFERLQDLETAQIETVSRLGEQAGQSGEALKRTLDLAGLDVERLLDRMARAAGEHRGVGGPLLALDSSPGSDLAHQIAAVDRRVDDLQRLQELMERLPLVVPLDEFRTTSGFGRRIDPFTKRLAFHSGIDLASRRRAPVRVTSAGVVTFVGWKGGFGKLAEVDHGLGVRTRYGHLSTIFVKRGQRLEFREKVGLIGSTGRSSGEHLHYEILVDGRPQDPANFIKAGQYVFKK
ncbi:MAG: hypothetical protein CL566_08255 [Alphaproteobacteria bacterium]|nr:hypothetical protein [Alphaproteobacteria bacterium]